MLDTVLPRLIPFKIPEPIRGLAARLLGLDEIERIYGALQTTPGDTVADRLLRYLSDRCAVDDADLAHLARSGAAIVTAYHPFGILDGAALVCILL
jgi:hypothetical protein